jgi:hypothetical protein
MTADEFMQSLAGDAPPDQTPPTLRALWYEAKGDWPRAHALVDELETSDGMAVHAYLHRKEGSASNAEYWYRLGGSGCRRPTLEAEWSALVEFLLREA